MRLCLFPTSGTMSQPVLVCMQEASEYICISLKGENEEMLQNQPVCGLTTSICTCLSAWKSDTEKQSCLLSDRLTEEYMYFLKSTFCLMFSCNTGANLSMKHVKERSSQKLRLITDWLMNWTCFHMQSCKHLREDVLGKLCILYMFSNVVLSSTVSFSLMCVPGIVHLRLARTFLPWSSLCSAQPGSSFAKAMWCCRQAFRPRRESSSSSMIFSSSPRPSMEMHWGELKYIKVIQLIKCTNIQKFGVGKMF